MENKKEIYYYRESYLQSLMSDLQTFGFLFLSFAMNYYLCGDNQWMNCILTIMFLLCVASKASGLRKVFYNREDLIKYLQEEK